MASAKPLTMDENSILVPKQENTSPVKLWKTIISGSMGGLACTVVGHPLETIKTRLQTGATKNIFSGCYKGMLSPIVGLTPFFASSYFGFRLGRYLTGQREDVGSIMLSGGVAGLVSTAARTPVDRVKIVAQNERISSQEAFKKLVRSRGFFGVYQGVGATAFWLVPSQITFWGGIELWTMVFKDMDENLSPFLAGGLAGMSEWAFCLPFDTVKTRVQAGTDPTVGAAIKSVYTGGIRSMYRGFLPMMLRAFPANGAAIWTIKYTDRMLKDI